MIVIPEPGSLPGIVVSAVSHEGLSVTIDGKPGRLAILNEAGEIVASGSQVASEVEAVALLNYRQFLQGKGYLRVVGKPINASNEGRKGAAA